MSKMIRSNKLFGFIGASDKSSYNTYDYSLFPENDVFASRRTTVIKTYLPINYRDIIEDGVSTYSVYRWNPFRKKLLIYCA